MSTGVRLEDSAALSRKETATTTLDGNRAAEAQARTHKRDSPGIVPDPAGFSGRRAPFGTSQYLPRILPKSGPIGPPQDTSKLVCLTYHSFSDELNLGTYDQKRFIP